MNRAIPARRSIVAVVLCCTVGSSGGCERSDESGTPDPRVAVTGRAQFEIRNVILISIDTLRADHLGCYGHDSVKTPTIDAIAAEGILFEQHINPIPTTLASHTSMFTGTYPHTHGVSKNRHHVSDENVMLPEILQQAGFVTAGFVGAAPLAPSVNFHQGFEHYDAEFGRTEDDKGKPRGQRRADEVSDVALAWLGRHGQSESGTSDGEERLFLFVHYFDVHWPYTAPAPFARMYRTDSTDADGSMKTVKQARSWLRRGFRSPGEHEVVVGAGRTRAEPPSEGIVRHLWERGISLAGILDAEYSAEITFCDQQLGRLIEGLKTRGLFDNSLIIVTSDHGETMHEHDNVFNHGVSVYDTEIHTPLILRFPGGQFGGRRIGGVVSGVDVMPTILELLGLPRHDDIEGECLAAVVAGSLPSREPVFAEASQPWDIPEFDNDPVWCNRGKFQCIRSERYKYMFRIPDQQFRFYDLTADPGEQTNLLEGGREYDRAIVDDLKKRLLAWHDDAHPIHSQPVGSPDHIDALRDLGYVGGQDNDDDPGDGE